MAITGITAADTLSRPFISYICGETDMEDNQHVLRTVNVTRYVTPLREGGSLPAIAEADDGFLYVLKFRGAGQGAKALTAELIGGEMARALGLKVPEIVFARLDASFGRTEPDEEIQDLLKASVGLNIALHYLSGAITYDPAVTIISPELASKIVWLDCLLMNVDRTPQNTNMLIWHKELWLIDHGSSLYFHYSDTDGKEAAGKPFERVKDHVLLPQASELPETDTIFRGILTDDRIRSIVSLVPGEWFNEEAADKGREMYFNFLTSRVAASGIFVNEALHARKTLI